MSNHPNQATQHTATAHNEELETRVGELEAAVEALEAYIGHVKRTDDELEQRANAALTAVEDLESRVQALESVSEPPTAASNSQKPAAQRLAHQPDEACQQRSPSEETAAPQPGTADTADEFSPPAPMGGTSKQETDEELEEATGLLDRLRSEL